MSDIIRGEQIESTAYFCPKCHNPVDIPMSIFSAPIEVRCAACDWSGTHLQLVQSSFKHEFKSDEEIAQSMMTDLRNLLAKSAASTYGRWLLKWGFLDQPVQAAQLGRYIMEIAKAVTKTVIELRKTIVEEKARERIGR